jgi:hypothetical protein
MEMSDAARFAITSLATYRISRLVVEDEISAPIRNAIWKKYPPEKSKIGYLLTCYWCSSIYAASALEISRIIAPKTTRVVETALAASAVAGIVAARLED